MLYEQKILDGRCRYLACNDAGVEPRCVVFTGSDPVAYVLSKNLPRRHLTASQLAIAAAILLPLYEAEAKKRMLAGRSDPPVRLPEGSSTPPQAAAETPGEAREKVGKMVGVSSKYISDAKKILAVAPQEIAAIKAGAKSIPQVLKEITPKPQPAQFDEGKRWEAVEAYLADEREFWPVEHRGYLVQHVADLLLKWNDAIEGTVHEDPPAPVDDINQAVVGSAVEEDMRNTQMRRAASVPQTLNAEAKLPHQCFSSPPRPSIS